MRRGMSRASSRAGGEFDPSEAIRRRGAPGAYGSGPRETEMGMQQLTRHQLYDEPMPLDAADKLSFHSGQPSPGLAPNPPRSATLKFAEEDRVHQCEFSLVTVVSNSTKLILAFCRRSSKWRRIPYDAITSGWISHAPPTSRSRLRRPFFRSLHLSSYSLAQIN